MSKSKVPVVSFSQVASKSSIHEIQHDSPSDGIYLSPVYNTEDFYTQSISSEAMVNESQEAVLALSMASKKLLKKDSITRLKGFTDIDYLLFSSHTLIQVPLAKSFLPHFAYLYPRLALVSYLVSNCLIA